MFEQRDFSPQLHVLVAQLLDTQLGFLIVGAVKIDCAHQAILFVQNVGTVVRHGTAPIRDDSV
jgi:hypothetical protein